MASHKVVAYYRVSTARQGQSGLGLDAQRRAVVDYLQAGDFLQIAEFKEIETGKKATLDNRPKLRAALDLCRKERALLVIAKLDRLARNVHFVSGLIESKVEFVAADMSHANKVMIQMHAVMSEWERDQISRRTRDALASAKARGVKLGVAGPANLRPVNEARRSAANSYSLKMRTVILGLQARGLSQRKIVSELNALGIPAPRGGRWHLPTLQRQFSRLESADGSANFQTTPMRTRSKLNRTGISGDSGA